MANLLLDTWPQEVAEPIAAEVHRVLTTARGDVLTAARCSRSISRRAESRACASASIAPMTRVETRSWMLLRLESIAYVLVGALALLALAFLVVLGAAAVRDRAQIRALARTARIDLHVRAVCGGDQRASRWRSSLVHKWLPAGHRRFREIAPGILVTLVMWLAGGILFGRYLAEFASTYVTYYAGLASVMIALVFLYLTASIFMYGGELNSAICRPRGHGSRRAQSGATAAERYAS